MGKQSLRVIRGTPIEIDAERAGIGLAFPMLCTSAERRLAKVKVWLNRCATQYKKGATLSLVLHVSFSLFTCLFRLIEDVLHVLLEGKLRKITETTKE